MKAFHPWKACRGLGMILGGSRIKTSVAPASAAPRQIAWQPLSLLPGNGAKGRGEGVDQRAVYQLLGVAEWIEISWVQESTKQLNMRVKTWEMQSNDTDTKD